MAGNVTEQQTISSLRDPSGEASTTRSADSRIEAGDAATEAGYDPLTLYSLAGFALSLLLLLGSKFLGRDAPQSKPGRKLAAGGGGQPERLQQNCDDEQSSDDEQSCDDDTEMESGMIGLDAAVGSTVQSACANPDDTVGGCNAHIQRAISPVGDEDETILALDYRPPEGGDAIGDDNETILALDYHPRIANAVGDVHEDDGVAHRPRPKMKKKGVGKVKKVFGKRSLR